MKDSNFNIQNLHISGILMIKKFSYKFNWKRLYSVIQSNCFNQSHNDVLILSSVCVCVCVSTHFIYLTRSQTFTQSEIKIIKESLSQAKQLCKQEQHLGI